MARGSEFQEIDILAGVQPNTDMTEFRTKHYVYSDKVRFMNGAAQKIGGWGRIVYDYDATVSGCIRSIFSENIDGKIFTMLGTNTHVYSVLGSSLTNITPLDTDTITIANSIDTHYATLSNNPLASTSGSPVLTVTDSEAALFQVGDLITLSGATGFAGIMAGTINGDHIVRSIGSGTFTINVGVNANATTTGGGAAVKRASGLITITDATHGQNDGDRVKISGAANTGGILAGEINLEFIIRNVSTNTFDVMTEGTATSSVTAGGGAATEYQQEIPEGNLNQAAAQGYGAGLYGAGLYGTALVSSLAISYPRIWFFDRFADTIISTAGNQTGLYQWLGDTSVAPELISNAPTEINYAFESDNIIVTLGASDMGSEVQNRIFACDQNNITQWTSSSTNQVFDDDIEGAGRLISHAPIDDYNLIFSENQTYTFRYIGLPFVWEIKSLEDNIGLIAPLARVSIKGTVYWMGLENFYRYTGGHAQVIPANSQMQSTLRDYVFNDINLSQSFKFHAWFNKKYQEVWFHYCSSASNECDRVAVVNILDNTWVPHKLTRSAAQNHGIIFTAPLMADFSTVYQHEYGYDADGAPLKWELLGNQRYYGTYNINVNNIIPDSIQIGTITFRYDGFLYPQSPVPIYSKSAAVLPTTGFVSVQDSSRIQQYYWTGEELGQNWKMGTWLEEIQKGSEK